MFKVMIVDDYEFYRKELRAMDIWGASTGFQVLEEAIDGRDALNKLRCRPVDLLLTDIRMPSMNGLDLLERVVEEKLSSCIILMSQFSDFEYARKGLASGAFDYLLKPVEQNDLQNVLLRAADYIAERHDEIAKIKYFDHVINKSSEEYFPAESFGSVVSHLTDCSMGALEAASTLIDITSADVGTDVVKLAHITNNVQRKLIETVQAEFPWTGKFTDLQAYKLCDYSKMGDASIMKERFLQHVESILTLIRKYELGDDSSMVRMACRTVLENIDSELTINELANMLFITRTYLSQVFKDKTGINLSKYMTEVKIERAKILLSGGAKSRDVSETLGYKDVVHFKKLFKKETGLTIMEYKDSLTG